MEFHRLCRNPASEIAVSIAFQSAQISLAILSLDAAQPVPWGALGLDTNEVTPELPGASSREGSWEAAAEFRQLRPQPADHSLLQDVARVPHDSVPGDNGPHICFLFLLIQLSAALKHPPSFA